MKHLLEIDDLTPVDLEAILLRSAATDIEDLFPGQGIALIFEMPSARTRNSAEMAAVQLGAHPVHIDGSELGFDHRETVEDITRTLAGYYTIVCARVFEHAILERMAAVDAVPVVNLLSKDSHPLQALADVLTIRQEFGDTSGRTIAYVGYPGNVWRSLSMAAGMLAMDVRLAAPPGHQPSDDDLDRIKRCGTRLDVTSDSFEAVEGADVVYTDRWVSMGEEQQSGTRRKEFAGFTVTDQVMSCAAEDAIFLHCLPAKRGEEVSPSVIDGERSRIWPQARNRMHTARGVFSWLMVNR
jgi:ornithine carbamoyltransferase